MTKHEAAREIVKNLGNCTGINCSECPLCVKDCGVPSGKKANASAWLAANPEQKEKPMKYKIDPIPGMPEWFVPGIVCRVRQYPDDNWERERPLAMYDGSNRPFRDRSGQYWAFAEPVERWEPQKGEIIAKWCYENPWFMVAPYTKPFENWHYARLQYPDGRVVDCACDVETLKTRTEWL